MDIASLTLEFSNFYLVETILKRIVYLIKPKPDLAILGKLVQVVQAKLNCGQSHNNGELCIALPLPE
jgi:hypothetical protein